MELIQAVEYWNSPKRLLIRRSSWPEGWRCMYVDEQWSRILVRVLIKDDVVLDVEPVTDDDWRDDKFPNGMDWEVSSEQDDDALLLYTDSYHTKLKSIIAEQCALDEYWVWQKSWHYAMRGWL